MKKMNYSGFAAAILSLSLFALACKEPAAEKATTAAVTAVSAPPVAAKPDMAKLKADIQALENSWAAADNASDSNTLAALYADDAVSMNSDRTVVGKAAIKKDIASSFAKKTKGATVSYDIMDVFGDENTVTEIGVTTRKDASGKVTSTGKYMAIWEKRDGKYVCLRDIGYDDIKKK